MRSNTFDPRLNQNKNPDKANSEKDFDTYSVQSKMSYQKQPPANNSTISNNQKMTKNIVETLKKLYKDSDKNIYLAGFKPTQKTLLSTISTFLNSFDNSFEQSTLTIQMIPEIFRLLGYTNTISKTYFQPVGAPHTWGQCLAMMEWLGDLAAFHLEMRVFLEDDEGGMHQDFTSTLIRSFIENDPSITKRYLEAQIDRKHKAIEGFRYNISTMNIEIENQKSAQKGLKELDDQQKILEQILYRETQEAIQIQHQNTEMQRKLKDLKNKVREQEMLNQIRQNQIKSLTKEVQNQELSVEQVQKIKYQIKQTRQKITQLKRFEERQKQTLDKTDQNIINDYLEFNKTLEALRHMYRKHKKQMDDRNIYLEIPECDVIKFREFLKNRTEQCTDVAVEEILGIKQINDLKDKANFLLNIVDEEIKTLDKTKQEISNQNQRLNAECLNKEMQNAQQESKLTNIKSKINGIQYEIQTVQLQVNQFMGAIKSFDNQIKQLHDQESSIMDLAQKFIHDVTEWGEINKTIKPEADQTVEKMAMELIDLKVDIIEKVSEVAQSIQEFNEDMGFVEFVSRKKNKMQRQTSGNQGENQDEKVELVKGENEKEREEQNEGIEGVRGIYERSADEEYDYMSLFGQGAYQSPKPEKVNRMLQRGYRN